MRSTQLLLLATLASSLAAREVDVRPAPAWVDQAAIDARVAVQRESVRFGIYDILNDHQAHVEDDEWHYFRMVRRVLSPTGVQNASEISLDFDPSFQRLLLHRVDIHRDGYIISAFDPQEVRIIDKEDAARERIYDGQKMALVFVRDVRPGDVIDYSWSVVGANPILGGLFTDELDLSSTVPAQRVRHRLLWPAGRPLQWRGGEPVIAMQGNHQLFTWDRSDVRAIAIEDAIPSWYEPWEMVEVSEFASWHEVATWAYRMFQLDAKSVQEVAALAGVIRDQHSGRDAQIAAAIRFVQDDIRYLGIEMGRNSHQPHQPWETLASRWGDCKDKTLLLTALLRELGADAVPALVSTTLRHRLDTRLPSPFVFDHVIVRVSSAGRVWWIDPTIANQGGTLATIETPNDGLALLVDPTARGLTPIRTNQSGGVRVEQTYTTSDWASPVTLEVRTTWSGFNADRMRSQLADLSIEDFAIERINALAIDQPAIKAEGLPAIQDDRVRNSIVVRERYRIPRLWRDGQWTWYPRVLESYLERPDTMIRSMPLGFRHPLDVTQTVRFNFPETVDVDTSTSVTETPAFRYEYAIDQNGRTITVRQSLRGLRGWVETGEVADHLTKINAIWSRIGYRMAPRGAQPVSPRRLSGGLRWGVGIAVVAAFVALCWHLASRPAPRLATSPSFYPGEAPASAVLVRDSNEIESHLASLTCGCGGTMDSSEVHRARYAERDMTIVTRHCRSCGNEQSVYFTAA